MTRVIAITNQKGGVGKTTTGINLCASLAKTRRRVLLIDLDPQGNATTGSGIDREEVEYSIYDVLLKDKRLDETCLETSSGYAIVPSESGLAGIQVELSNAEDRDHRLKNAIAALPDRFDYIFIDCPPALNVLTINALAAADSVLIPVQCEYYALEGLSGLLETIARIREGYNPDLKIEGILRTMFDGRNSLANEVSDQLHKHFGDTVFRTKIPRNVRLAEAPSYGKAVIEYDPACAGSQAYLALAGELLRESDG
ncbi:MAG: cobyric acid synthase CobQ [marine bacterium B5-7]|nr:MAG: cobyric acid synthase CobQ [marine bacterium B5-7]